MSDTINPGKTPHMNMQYGQTNLPVEFVLTATGAHSDPGKDLDVDVTVEGPDGTRVIPAFWGGDRNFRVRFAGALPGRYNWCSTCTDQADGGLHDRWGSIEIAPYAGASPLCRHGRLRMAASRRTLEHADGTPFFWLGDTWWMGLTTRLDWPHGFQYLTADRVAKGFNVVQIVAGPLPDFDAAEASFDKQQANEAGWSWEPGWTGINPAFYDLADLRIAWLVEQGIVPCIVGMWGYYLSFMGVDKVKRHWRNLVARYGAYPVVWCLAGEANMATYSYHAVAGKAQQEKAVLEKGWTEVMQTVRALDPFRNPITIHPSHPDSRAMVRDAALLDIDMLQTGHGGYSSLKPSVDVLRTCVAGSPRLPTLNAEVCYEGIMGGSKDEVQRFLFWTAVTLNACGHTYGAQGIWAMSSRSEPFRGTTGSWGEGFWQDVMHYQGSKHVGLGAQFLRRYPWWLFEPRIEPEVEKLKHFSSFACGIPGKVAFFYLPPNCVDGELLGIISTWNGFLAPIRIETGANYSAFFWNPRNGSVVLIGKVVPDANGFWSPPRKPGMDDWLLVLEDRAALDRMAEQSIS